MKISEINSAIQSATNLLSQLGCNVKVTNAQGLVFKPFKLIEAAAKKKKPNERFSHADRNLDELLKDLEPGQQLTLRVIGTPIISLQSAMLNACKKMHKGPKTWYTTKDVKGKTVTLHMKPLTK